MKGIYFKSEKDNTSHFLLTHEVKSKNHNCVVKVYDIELPQEDLKNGDIVESFDGVLFVTIDIWNKYYFPQFTNIEDQWYHNYSGKEDRIGAVSDVMKYALDLGKSEGEIEIY